MGRKSKLTDDAEDRFIRAVGAGVPAEVAARHAGFSAASFYRYFRGGTPRYAAFRARYLQTMAGVEIRLAGTVMQAAMSDPKWALIVLERRFPEHWGRRRIDDTIDEPDDRSNSTQESPIVLDPALLDDIVPRLLAAGRQLSGQPASETDLTQFADDGTQPVETNDGDAQ